MQRITKILALILCILFIGIAFMACNNPDESEKKDNTDENPDGGSLMTEIRDDVPELDFGGYEFKVLFCTYGARSGVYFYPEEEESEILNDTIYARNRKIEDRFKIKFAATQFDDSNGLDSLNLLKKNVMAGDDFYDLHMLVDRNAQSAAAGNLLYPIGEVPHIDLTKPYWLADINSQLTIQNKLYWAFSDEVLSLLEATTVLYFNKKTVSNLGIEDLYNLVDKGEWTYDKFFEFSKAGINNVTGGNKMTEDDYWGIVSEWDNFYPNFWVSAGIYSVDKDEDDIPYFSLPGNEKFLTIAEKVLDRLERDGMYMEAYELQLPSGLAGTAGRLEYFKGGRALFSVGLIQEMIELRDMPDDFGVIPFPKYDAEQPRYYARVVAGRPLVIPSVNRRPDIAGAVMEAMACETHNTVFPAYYETALKKKFSRDPETVRMLDLIRANQTYDLGDTIWCDPIRVPLTAIFVSGQNTFSSWLEMHEKRLNAVIDKMTEEILNLD